MFGKRPDAPFQPDHMLEIAVDRWIGNIRELGSSREAQAFALQSDLVYECHYRLEWWQKLAFPVLSIRLLRLQNYLGKWGPNDLGKSSAIRRTVAKLEFGKKIPPAHVLQIVRHGIICHGCTNWQVRQAFNSKALERSKNGLILRHQPALLRQMSAAACWVFMAASIILFGALVYETFLFPSRPLVESYFGLSFHFCVLLTGVFFHLGQQWERGTSVMQQIWPLKMGWVA